MGWRAGDRDAGDALIARHFDALFRFFDGKLGHEGEDLVQRTLLDCLESRAVVQSGNFRAYLFGVARNRLIDFLRARVRAGAPVDLAEVSIADLRTSASKRLARTQDEQLLREALRGIPVDHQIALELTYWEGMSGREVAAVLGIDPNTVRSRLSRARDALRERLRHLGASHRDVASSLAGMSEPG